MKKNKKPTRETNPFKLVKPIYNESKYIRWVSAYTPSNVGRLGHSKIWKYKKQKKYEYY